MENEVIIFLNEFSMLRNIALFYYDVLSFECLECAPIYHLVFAIFSLSMRATKYIKNYVNCKYTTVVL